MGLCGLLVGLLVLTGSAQLWQVYLAALCLGLASAIDGPARQAFVSELVGQDNLSNAVALNSASFNTARLTGPAIAGVLIAWIGTGPVFLLNAASFAAVIVSLWRIRSADLRPSAPALRGKHQVIDGLGYVRRRPDLVLILVMVGILGAFGMNFPITNALMSTAEFGMGPGEFGLLGSIMAVGTLAGALLAARRSGPRLRFLLGGAVGLGFFTLVGSVSPNFWVYAAVLIPVGPCLNNVPEQLQHEHPALSGTTIQGTRPGALPGSPAGRNRPRCTADGVDRHRIWPALVGGRRRHSSSC